nr:YbdD/YjiX family protein [Neisseria subflava]
MLKKFRQCTATANNRRLRVKHKLASWWKTIKLTANLMAGVPDYENYVARQRKHNPNAPVMTELQFQDYCRKRRCGGNGGRCC